MDGLNKDPHSLPAGSDDHDPEHGKSVGKRALVNKLNYLNFQDSTILITLKHVRYGSTISLSAKPLPCSGDRLDCVWDDVPNIERILTAFSFQSFLIADGRKFLLVEPEVTGMTDQGISFNLPESCREVVSRKAKRHPAKGISARLIQNGAEFHGALRDFNAVSFRIELKADAPRTFYWIDAASPVHLSFSAGEKTFYSGECRIIRQSFSDTTGTFVLEPLHHQLRRFKPKEYRAARQELVPSPHIVFKHPLSNTFVSLRVVDLSSSGFSVEEDEGNSVLLPGLILAEMEISFNDSFRIGCSAQVVYRNPVGEGNGGGLVRCGLAILDMAIADHVRLMALLHQAADANSYLCARVDMDALWSFFFETGFIYPEKYASLQESKEEMKLTYERLYNQHPGIARHFIYQNRGKILGHMAMVRFYENSWLIHHHAASKSDTTKAGLTVLNQISRYVNDINHLRSAHLNYVFCYFRPDNKFPNRVFGEFAIKLNDLQGCSLDTFAYFHHRPVSGRDQKLPAQWALANAQSADLEELHGFYQQESGGLMVKAFDLGAEGAGHDRLVEEYRDLGFRKERHLFALKKGGELKALIMANITDIGLNMSNLTSCATVIVLDEAMPRSVLDGALSTVAAKYGRDDVPVLVYPVSYAERESLPSEKMYSLWVLNLHYLDHYFKFCDALFHADKKSS